MNKQTFLKFSGRVVSLTNLVSNGDMSNGTTDWSHYSTYSTESIVSGELKSLRNTNRPTPYNVTSWGVAVGHKVYTSNIIYGNKSGNVDHALYGVLGTSESGRISINVTTSPQLITNLFTVATTTANGIAFDATSFTSSGNYIMLDNVVAIDLTSAFGAGNEPTKAQMDGLMTQFANNYFNGTQYALCNW